MISGCLIMESLKVGTVVELPQPLHVRRIRRVAVDLSNGETQPGTWTLVDFYAADDADDFLADTLAQCLIADGGWYADYTIGEHTRVVVFADKGDCQVNGVTG